MRSPLAPTAPLSPVVVTGIAAVLLLGLLGSQAWPLFRLAGLLEAVPAWDEAKYLVSGLRLYQAASAVDGLAFLRHLNAQSVWPPGFPLLEALAFAGWGTTIGVARQLAASLFASTLILAWWSLRKSRVPLAGLWLALALGFSPLTRTVAVLAMLEIAGLAGLLAAFGAYARALDAELRGLAAPLWWRATWLLSTLLFFCKYNYGLLWLIPLLSHEWWRRQGAPPWRHLGSELAGTFPFRRHWIAKFWWVLLGALGLLGIWLRFTGGRDFKLGPWTLSVHSAGNLAYGILWLALATIALVWWRDPARARANWSDFEARWDGIGAWLVMPITVWLLIPPHMQDLVGFLENRSSGLGLVEGLLFYPRVFARDFLPDFLSPWCLLAILAGFGWQRRRHLWRPSVETFAVWAATWGVLALVGHGYKQDRFILQAACWILVVGAVGLSSLLGGVRREIGIVVGCFGWLCWSYPFEAQDLVARTHAYTAPASQQGLLQAAIAVLPAEAQPTGLAGTAVSPKGQLAGSACWQAEGGEDRAPAGTDSSVVVGTWNLLSPWLVEWHAVRAGRVVPTMLLSQRDRKALAHWVASAEPPRQWLVLDPPEEPAAAKAFAAENPDHVAWVQRLETDLRYRELPLEARGIRLFCLKTPLPGR